MQALYWVICGVLIGVANIIPGVSGGTMAVILKVFDRMIEALSLKNLKQNWLFILCVGVGGSFDVYAGVLRRAPRFWQKVGCEWLYRLFQEPWRLKRDFQLLAFVLAVFREQLNVFPWREKDHA